MSPSECITADWARIMDTLYYIRENATVSLVISIKILRFFLEIGHILGDINLEVRAGGYSRGAISKCNGFILMHPP